MQPCQLLVCSHGQHFDAAVVIVAHPSSNLQNVRLTLDKPAKANALDTSAHQKAASLNLSVRSIVCGSHGSSEERSIEDLPYCARDKYVPSAVSTLIFSPSLMNGGT